MAEATKDSQARIEIATSGDTVVIKQLTTSDSQEYLDLIDHDRDHYSQFDGVTAKTYKTVEDIEQSIQGQKPNKYRFGIWDGAVLVGSNNITVYEDGKAEVAFWIGKQFTGQGYAARALKPLLEFAFTDLNLDEVFTTIFTDNVASRKTVEKAGFVFKELKDKHWIHVKKRESYGG